MLVSVCAKERERGGERKEGAVWDVKRLEGELTMADSGWPAGESAYRWALHESAYMRKEDGLE